MYRNGCQLSWFDSDFSFSKHVQSVFKDCFVQLRDFRWGKTSISCEKWPQHLRISLDELLETSASLSLRQVLTNHLLKPLKQGHSVVVDDCNHKKARRLSCVNLIAQKLPGVGIRCCVVRPTHGTEQMLWRREQDMAQDAHLTGETQADWSRVEQLIRGWDRLADLPSSDEGFQLEEHNTHITVHTPFKMELAGLFIQLESLYTCAGAGGLRLVRGVHEAITSWYARHPAGRCVLIQDTVSQPGVSASEKEHNAKYILKETAARLTDCVVYLLYISSESVAGSYCVPPNPGPLAYLSRLHLIDLQAKGSMYWYHTSAHMKMAERAGLKHIKASKVFSHTNLASHPDAAIRPALPPMLQTLRVCAPLPHTTDLYMPRPMVPLWHLCTEDTSLVSHKTRCGRTLHLAYREHKVMQRYHDLYLTNASPITSEAPGRLALLSQECRPTTQPSQHASVSLTESPRDLPAWMSSGQQRRRKQKEGRSVRTGPPARLRTSGSATMYVMSEEELLHTATSLLTQSGEPVPSQTEVQLYLSQRQGHTSWRQGQGDTSTELGQSCKTRAQETQSQDNPVSNTESSPRPGEGSGKMRERSRRRTAEKERKTDRTVKRSRLDKQLEESMAEVEEILGTSVEGGKAEGGTASSRTRWEFELEELMVTSEMSAPDVSGISPQVSGTSPQVSGISPHTTGAFNAGHESQVAALRHGRLADTSEQQFDALLSSLAGETKRGGGQSGRGSAGSVSTGPHRTLADRSDPVCETVVRESDLGSKSSAGSEFVVPDSFVKNSSDSTSLDSRPQCGGLRRGVSGSSRGSGPTVPDSLVPSSGSLNRSKTSSKTSSVDRVADSFVGSSGSVKDTKPGCRQGSRDQVADSFVSESSSLKSGQSKPVSMETVPESWVANTPSVKGSHSSKGSVRSVADSWVASTPSVKSSHSSRGSVRSVADSFVKDSSSYGSKPSVDRSVRGEVAPDSFVKDSSSCRSKESWEKVSDECVVDSFVKESSSYRGSRESGERGGGEGGPGVVQQTPSVESDEQTGTHQGGRQDVTKQSPQQPAAMETDLSILDDLI